MPLGFSTHLFYTDSSDFFYTDTLDLFDTDDSDFFYADDSEDMDDKDTIDIDESSNRKNEQQVASPVIKPYIRDGLNPFEFYNEIEFKQRFRLSKDCIMHGILPRIRDKLVKSNNQSISPELQLLICLRYYATANVNFIDGDCKILSQSILTVSTLLADEITSTIQMPISEKARKNNQELFRKLGASSDEIGLPEIDGAIDCTHIRLSPTNLDDKTEDFRNCKGYFSLNVQTVVGPRGEFIDIVPMSPGKQPDSRIFEDSKLHKRYDNGELNGALVGDSAYPCLQFLLTPLVNPITEADKKYNAVHRRTREIVEKTIGKWKRRFPCLSKGLGMKLECTARIIVACAVLHNWSLTLDNVLPEEDPLGEEEAVPSSYPHWQCTDGYIFREYLIQKLFRPENPESTQKITQMDIADQQKLTKMPDISKYDRTLLTEASPLLRSLPLTYKLTVASPSHAVKGQSDETSIIREVTAEFTNSKSNRSLPTDPSSRSSSVKRPNSELISHSKKLIREQSDEIESDIRAVESIAKASQQPIPSDLPLAIKKKPDDPVDSCMSFLGSVVKRIECEKTKFELLGSLVDSVISAKKRFDQRKRVLKILESPISD